MYLYEWQVEYMRIVKYFSLFTILILLVACQAQLPKNADNDMILDNDDKQVSKDNNINTGHDGCKLQVTVVMKGVGIYTPQSDFYEMKSACIDVVTTEWGMEESIDDVKTFLNRANNAGLKVVLDGGFSLIAWGFNNDDWYNLPEGKSPVWQKNRVQEWISHCRSADNIHIR